MIAETVAVALAGGIGAAVRYLADVQLSRVRRLHSLPWATMLINLSGSFLAGIVAGFALTAVAAFDVLGGVVIVDAVRIIAIGFLGGYTTFSTATLDAVLLVRRRRYGAALTSLAVVLLGSVLLASLGYLLGCSLGS